MRDVIVRNPQVGRALQPVSHAMHRSDYAIVDAVPAHAPNSKGSVAALAHLTLLSAQQTFPFLVELLDGLGSEALPVRAAADFCQTDEQRTAAAQLKVLFDRYGSDKSNDHDYHLVYGAIVDRHCRAILEIGLGTNNDDVPSTMGRNGSPGASLRAFRDYLLDAQVYGADVDRRVLFQEERISTFFVDQTDLGSVRDLAGWLPGDLDLIIDDGLHSPAANIAILNLAASKLRVGGWVVVEDIGAAAVPVWQVVAVLLGQRYDCSIVQAADGVLFLANRRS